MKQSVLSDGTVMYYAVKLNGRIITPPLVERYSLQQHIATLPKDQQALAEIVTVTQSGQELLLG